MVCFVDANEYIRAVKDISRGIGLGELTGHIATRAPHLESFGIYYELQEILPEIEPALLLILLQVGELTSIGGGARHSLRGRLTARCGIQESKH